MGINEVAPREREPSMPRRAAEEERRQKILVAAEEHFRLYGYNKTSMADLARSIGVSNTYVYIFFKSKQAVGEAICEFCLDKIVRELERIVESPQSAADRIRLIYAELALQGKQLFFEERKLHDIVVVAVTEKWSAIDRYLSQVQAILRRLVSEGREKGEFERKTPLDETCRAIMQTLLPFVHPVLLQEKLEEIEANATSVAGLVLRSLSY